MSFTKTVIYNTIILFHSTPIHRLLSLLEITDLTKCPKELHSFKMNISHQVYLKMISTGHSCSALNPFVSPCSCLRPQHWIMSTCPDINTKGIDVCSIHVIPKWQALSFASSSSWNRTTNKPCCIIHLSWPRCFNVHIPAITCKPVHQKNVNITKERHNKQSLSLTNK